MINLGGSLTTAQIAALLITAGALVSGLLGTLLGGLG